MDKNIIRKEIFELLKSQKYAVIATQGNEELYTNLVAFFSSDNLKNLYFVTSNKSKKYFNLVNNPNISVLIDDRKNSSDDVLNAKALTATGEASLFDEDDSEILNQYLEKHPKLNEFIKSSDSVFIDIKVKNFVYVNRFKEKIILDFT